MNVVKITTSEGFLFTSGNIRTKNQTNSSTANSNDLVTFSYTNDTSEALTSSISSEVSRAISSENSLTTRVSLEEVRAKASEELIITSIEDLSDNVTAFGDSVLSRMTSVDSVLSSAISTEEVRAGASEVSLTSRVSEEEVRAKASDESLTTRVSEEEVRAGASEVSLTSRVSLEEVRAKASEVSLTSRVSAEEVRALSVEALLAPKNSPAFTGEPTAPTPGVNSNSTQIATTAYVTNAITNVIGGAPDLLNTLSEIAQALSGDASFAATMVSRETSLTTRVSLEEVRAGASEVSLTNRISAEEVRAKASEELIVTNVTNIKNDLSNNYVKNTTLTTTVIDISDDIVDYVESYTKVDVSGVLSHSLSNNNSVLTISCDEKLSRTFSTFTGVTGVTSSTFLTGITMINPLAGGKYRILLSAYAGAKIAPTIAFIVNIGDTITNLTSSNANIYKNYGSDVTISVDATNVNATNYLYLEIDYMGIVNISGTNKHIIYVRLV